MTYASYSHKEHVPSSPYSYKGYLLPNHKAILDKGHVHIVIHIMA